MPPCPAIRRWHSTPFCIRYTADQPVSLRVLNVTCQGLAADGILARRFLRIEEDA